MSKAKKGEDFKMDCLPKTILVLGKAENQPITFILC